MENIVWIENSVSFPPDSTIGGELSYGLRNARNGSARMSVCIKLVSIRLVSMQRFRRESAAAQTRIHRTGAYLRPVRKYPFNTLL